MQSITITPKHLQQMIIHAEESNPREACGILIGRAEQVMEVIPAENVASEPHVRYEIDPLLLARVLPEADRRGLELVGLYHSHPNGVPIPSTTDIREATFPETAYVIIGAKEKGSSEIAAWKITYGQVNRLDLHVQESINITTDPKPLRSNVQIFTLMVSVLLALGVLLAVALTLLPPAPAIP